MVGPYAEHCPAVRRAWADFDVLNDLDDPYFVMDLTPSKSAVCWANRAAVNTVGLSMDALLRLNLNSGNSSATQREFALMHQEVQVRMQTFKFERTVYPGGREFRFMWKCTPTQVLMPGETAARVLALVMWLPPKGAADKVENFGAKSLPLRATAEVLRHMPSLSTMFDMEQDGFPSIFTCVKSQTYYDEAHQFDSSRAESDSLGSSPRSQSCIRLRDLLESCVWDDVQGSDELILRIQKLRVGDPEIDVVCRKRRPGPVKQDSTTWHKIVFIPCNNPLSSIVKPALLVIEFDITSEVLVRADLSLAERAQGSLKDFVGAVSHELRTPLNGIMGLSDSLLSMCQMSKLQELQKMQETLLMIKQCGNRLKEMVDNIIDVTTIGRGELALTWKMVDLSDTAQRVCQQLRQLGRVRPQVTLVNTVTKACPLLVGDERRIQQVLYNLVSNALKFTAQGTVTVSAGQKGNHICIAVADTGCGVPMERRDEVWRPFTQVDMSATRQHGGAGLGLSIVKEVVEAHGGVVSMESHTEGSQTGSCFRCSFPMRQPDMEVHRMASAEEAEAAEVPDLAAELAGRRRGRCMSEISHCDTALSHCDTAEQNPSQLCSLRETGAAGLRAEERIDPYDAALCTGANAASEEEVDWLSDCFGVSKGQKLDFSGGGLHRISANAPPVDAISLLDPSFYMNQAQ